MVVIASVKGHADGEERSNRPSASLATGSTADLGKVYRR
jgi:hypothetical protein